MPAQESLAEIETAELILAVDDTRPATDPFKLPAYLRALVVARLADLRAKDAATLITEGGRGGGQIHVRAALDTLNTLLHDGCNFIKGIGSYAIPAAQRAAVFTAYGWVGGELGGFTDARIEALARQAADATPGIANPAHWYPPALLDLRQAGEKRNSTPHPPAQPCNYCAAPHPACGHVLPSAEKGISPFEAGREGNGRFGKSGGRT